MPRLQACLVFLLPCNSIILFILSYECHMPVMSPQYHLSVSSELERISSYAWFSPQVPLPLPELPPPIPCVSLISHQHFIDRCTFYEVCKKFSLHSHLQLSGRSQWDQRWFQYIPDRGIHEQRFWPNWHLYQKKWAHLSVTLKQNKVSASCITAFSSTFWEDCNFWTRLPLLF